jgi:hypothetical protein
MSGGAMTPIVKLAHKHGATHKANLGVYQFYEHELTNYTNAVLEQAYQVLDDLRGYSGVGAAGNPLDTESWNAALLAAKLTIHERVNNKHRTSICSNGLKPDNRF